MTYRNGHIYLDRWRLSMDPLLPLVLFVITWVLSERYYPDILFLETSLQYWLLGGATAIFITLSIIIHEVGHTLAARFFGIPIKRIHLFLFGGMAELQYRPQEARQEWWIAAMGPIASLLLAFFSWAMYTYWFTPDYLAYYFFKFGALINFLIAIFNLLPIFPLDGGRLLRAALWKWKGNYISASRLTNKTGSVFIGLLVILALADYLMFETGYSFIAGILALYMFYTYYTGRGELKYNPEPDELIFPIQNIENTREFVEMIDRKRPGLIAECIIPIFDGDSIIHQILDGRSIDLENENWDEDIHPRPITLGDYIDPKNKETFDKNVIFAAEWVPVLREGEFMGMCDSREMRFWLEQNYRLIF